MSILIRCAGAEGCQGAVVLRCCFAGFQNKRMHHLLVIVVLVVFRQGGGLFASWFVCICLFVGIEWQIMCRATSMIRLGRSVAALLLAADVAIIVTAGLFCFVSFFIFIFNFIFYFCFFFLLLLLLCCCCYCRCYRWCEVATSRIRVPRACRSGGFISTRSSSGLFCFVFYF